VTSAVKCHSFTSFEDRSEERSDEESHFHTSIVSQTIGVAKNLPLAQHTPRNRETLYFVQRDVKTARMKHPPPPLPPLGGDAEAGMALVCWEGTLSSPSESREVTV